MKAKTSKNGHGWPNGLALIDWIEVMDELPEGKLRIQIQNIAAALVGRVPIFTVDGKELPLSETPDMVDFVTLDWVKHFVGLSLLQSPHWQEITRLTAAADERKLAAKRAKSKSSHSKRKAPAAAL